MDYSPTSLVSKNTTTSPSLRCTQSPTNQHPTTPTSPTPPRRIPGSKWKRNGNLLRPRGSFKKASCVVSLTTFAMPSTNNIIPNSATYLNITPYQILEHLNNRWCPVDIKAKKEPKKAYYTKWDHAVEHLTAFGKRLDDNQRSLIRSVVTIVDDDKLQFYLEEIYDSNRFDKQEMLTWECEPSATKMDFDLTKTHFEMIVNATNTYEQNAGGGTAGRNRYESANQMADYGDEIREYIQQLASASAANNAMDTAANVQTTNKLTTMEVEIKKLTATIASMATKLNNGENINPNGGDNEQTRCPQMKKLRNMGAYCSSHGFHPVEIEHNSATCIYKKPEHKSKATWCNRLVGDMYWPNAKRVAVEQQDHPSWKGKEAPTN